MSPGQLSSGPGGAIGGRTTGGGAGHRIAPKLGKRPPKKYSE